MSIRKIIREEIGDLDWIRGVSYEDTLDKHFGIETNGEEAWFKGITDRNVIRPVDDMFKKLTFIRGGALYKIIYNDKIWKLDKGLINRMRIGNRLNNWRLDRIDKLKKYYPRMWDSIDMDIFKYDTGPK